MESQSCNNCGREWEAKDNKVATSNCPSCSALSAAEKQYLILLNKIEKHLNYLCDHAQGK